MENLTGKQLGPYQIVTALGEGGMAAVYKAYQPAMERYVALKILPRHFASDPLFVTRFQQEAKLLAQLQHPHILPVFDFGEADGYTYLVMPFVKSGTLAEALTGRPLPLSQVGALISQIGDALDYAHARGLVHRDVKPSNVLLDERGNCLLSDFGLAKIVAGSIKLTTSGAVLGTPAYMSPEQGLGQKLDQRSDIYSLGVMLYEMAVGRVPYRAETPLAVVVKHINDPLPLPRTVNPELSEALERVILKALAKKAEDRYATAGEMVRALQAALPRPSLAATSPVQPSADSSLPAKPVEPTSTEKPVQIGETARPSLSADSLRTTLKGPSTVPVWVAVAAGLLFAMCIGILAILGLGLAFANRPPLPPSLPATPTKIDVPPPSVQREYKWDFTSCEALGTTGFKLEIFDPGRVFSGEWEGNGCAMRFLAGGQSWMEATFTVTPSSQLEAQLPGAWNLSLYHLSSGVDATHAGYSPVQVTLNGRPVWQGTPNQAPPGQDGSGRKIQAM
jgi:serine/threonine protein kinase